MDAHRLLVHPPPLPTESPLGYVLRLTELNGYSSPRYLYRLAGLTGDEVSSSTLAFNKLALIANQSPSDMEKLEFKPVGWKSAALCLQGWAVSPSFLDLTKGRVCLFCVQDKGYIESHWHLEVMVACPTHKREAIYFCGHCRRTVKWVRRGLLTCNCGAPLNNVPLTEFTGPELDLLELVRAKALGDRAAVPERSELPVEQILAMDLQSLLSAIRFLGTQRLDARRSSKLRRGRHLLKAAATVLDHWPTNFLKLLKGYSSSTDPMEGSPVFVNLGDVYEQMQKATASRLHRHRQR
jgi:hypothetical protein